MERPKVVRFFGPLARKIGLVRSVVLLQIQFRIVVKGKDKYGNRWVRVNQRRLAKDIGYSVSKINRAIKWLYLHNYIHMRDDLNEKRFDKTMWYALNFFGIERLNGSWPGPENETTIYGYYYSNNNLKPQSPDDPHIDTYRTAGRVVRRVHIQPPVHDGPEEQIGDTSVVPEIPSAYQSALFQAKRRTRFRTHVNGPETIESFHYNYMYELCYGASNGSQAKLLNAKQRGRAADALATMKDAGVNLNELPQFEDWWKTQWMSKDRETRAYQRPRPEQVVEFWWASVKDRPKTEKYTEREEDDTSDLEERVRQFRIKQRREKETSEDDDDS